MTDVSSGGGDEPGLDMTPGHSPVQPDPALPEDVDLFIRNALASLETPRMPAAVAERIRLALAAETPLSAPPLAAAEPTEVAGPNPTADEAPRVVLPKQQSASRRRTSRWLIALPAVAVVAIISAVVGTSLLSTGGAPSSGTNVAAVVPMSASGTHYKQALLTSQVVGQLKRWRTMGTISQSPTPSISSTMSSAIDASTLPRTPTTTGPSASGSAVPSTTLGETVPGTSVIVTDSGAPITESVRSAVTTCIQSLGAGDPMHVDIGMYRDSEQGAELQVAVVAVPSNDNFVEIYVVNVGCTDSQQVLAHVHVPAG